MSEKPRKKKKKTAIAVILMLYAVLLAAVCYFVFYRPDTGGVDTFVEYSTDEFGNTVSITHDFEQRDGAYNFLILGEDREAALTDVCMLVHLDTGSGKVNILQLPRDTYVRGVDGVNNRSNKLNEVFADHKGSRIRAGESAEDAYKGALDDVTDLLEKNLCIRINFSLIMDLDGFCAIVDAVGGVEMDLPNALVYPDPEQGLYINLPAGKQILDGKAAEQFVRFRHDYLQGDLGRVNAQKLFLAAFFAKLKSCSLSALPDIAEAVFENVTTDLSLSDTVFFAKKLISADLSGMTMQTLPGQVANTGISHYIMNRAAALQVLNSSFNVYDKAVTDGIFDAAVMFGDPANTYISSFYYADANALYDGNVYTGDGAANGEINIPMKK